MPARNIYRHSQIQHLIGVYFGQYDPVHRKLADGVLQVFHDGIANETLDFYGNASSAFFRSQESLGTEINVHVLSTPGQTKRVMGNDPAILPQGGPDGFMYGFAGPL